MEEYVPNIKPEIKDLPQMVLINLCDPRKNDEKTIELFVYVPKLKSYRGML